MSKTEHNVSRRQTLAGIGLAGAVAIAPMGAAVAKAQPNRAAWNGAMAALRQADADCTRAVERYYRAQDTYKEITGDPFKFAPAQLDRRVDQLTGMSRAGDLSDEAMDRLADATDAVIRTPAPGHAELLWKIEHLGFTDSYCEEWAEAVLSDARRLLTAGRA